MADEISIRFIYPPNFSGTYDKHEKGVRRYIVNCTNYSDGSGESSELKLKRTDLRTPSGDTPTKLIIEKVEYDISGMTVDIEYNNTNNDKVATLYGSSGCLDFTYAGGFVPTYETNDGDSGLGDIIFNTTNETAGDSYNITLTVRVK